MPTRTPLTRERIEQQAAALAAQVAEFERQDQQRQEEEHLRRAQAQEKFDRQLVADYSAERAEADVKQARADLDAALADNPLVLALADFLAALRRKAHIEFEVSSARSRLGLPTFRPSSNVTELVGGLDEYVVRAVERIADERTSAEVADLHARRDAAGLD